jgi:hypothetical protein
MQAKAGMGVSDGSRGCVKSYLEAKKRRRDDVPSKPIVLPPEAVEQSRDLIFLLAMLPT